MSVNDFALRLQRVLILPQVYLIFIAFLALSINRGYTAISPRNPALLYIRRIHGNVLHPVSASVGTPTDIFSAYS